MINYHTALFYAAHKLMEKYALLATYVNIKTFLTISQIGDFVEDNVVKL